MTKLLGEKKAFAGFKVILTRKKKQTEGEQSKWKAQKKGP